MPHHIGQFINPFTDVPFSIFNHWFKLVSIIFQIIITNFKNKLTCPRRRQPGLTELKRYAVGEIAMH